MKTVLSACLCFAILSLGAVAAPRAAAEEAASAKGFDTPEAAYAAARDAFNAQDWTAFVAAVSPVRQNEIIGQLALVLAIQSGQPDSDPRIRALVDQYLPQGFDPMKVATSADAETEIVKLAEGMDNPQGFFVEAMSLIFTLEYGPRNPAQADNNATEKQTFDAQITGLTDLTITDGSAEGTVTIATSAGEQQARWVFAQHEGRWYLSMQ